MTTNHHETFSASALCILTAILLTGPARHARAEPAVETATVKPTVLIPVPGAGRTSFMAGSRSARIVTDNRPAGGTGGTGLVSASGTAPAGPSLTTGGPAATVDFKALSDGFARQAQEARARSMWPNQPINTPSQGPGARAWDLMTDAIRWLMAHPAVMIIVIAGLSNLAPKRARKAW
jgi:hypothetical protein